MEPYGHMLTTMDAALNLWRLKVISDRECNAILHWLNSLPEAEPGQTLPVSNPPEWLDPAMRKVWLASLMPATWTFQ